MEFDEGVAPDEDKDFFDMLRERYAGVLTFILVLLYAGVTAMFCWLSFTLARATEPIPAFIEGTQCHQVSMWKEQRHAIPWLDVSIRPGYKIFACKIDGDETQPEQRREKQK